MTAARSIIVIGGGASGILLAVTPALNVVAADGTPSDRLFAVGPLTRGQFFEIEAIPDIRRQCAELAARLLWG